MHVRVCHVLWLEPAAKIPIRLGVGHHHQLLTPEGCIRNICQKGNNGFDKWVFTHGYISPAWVMGSWGPIPILESSEPPFGFYIKKSRLCSFI